MKLKYYLRGAGIALILAVLLTNVSHRYEVSASTDASQKIVGETDEAEQEELLPSTEVDESQIEQAVMSENNTDAEDTQLVTQADVKTEAMTEMSDVEAEINEQNSNTISEQAENTVEEDVEEQRQTTATLTIEAGAKESYLLNIVSGDDSGTVSRKLYNAGLVDSASEFDAFLMQHGYDKKIRVGTVEVPFGATWLEIAEKLAGK